MRRIHSPARATVTIGLLCVAVAAAGGIAAAQTVPNTDAYLDPECFATVVPQVREPLGHVIGSREPGMHMYSTGDEIFLRGSGMELARRASSIASTASCGIPPRELR